jgi:glycerophosphoryl diester phosphodiesterase
LVKAIAHRGFSSRYPENTLLAFERALDLGADGAEFDVQLSRDGVPVVIHDESLLRTAGDERLVKDLTLEELQRWMSPIVSPGRSPRSASRRWKSILRLCGNARF